MAEFDGIEIPDELLEQVVGGLDQDTFDTLERHFIALKAVGIPKSTCMLYVVPDLDEEDANKLIAIIDRVYGQN